MVMPDLRSSSKSARVIITVLPSACVMTVAERRAPGLRRTNSPKTSPRSKMFTEMISPISDELRAMKAPRVTMCNFETQISTDPLTPGTGVQLAIREAAGGPLVGDLYLDSKANPSTVEVGITLAPGCHGCGLATAAITAVLDAVFGDVARGRPADRLIAVVDVDNLRS
jgi:Acetyltransferase (GNAT) domain